MTERTMTFVFHLPAWGVWLLVTLSLVHAVLLLRHTYYVQLGNKLRQQAIDYAQSEAGEHR